MSARRRGRLGVGDVIDGRFRLIDEIGEGGMGRIFEAVDERYDRPAAVKLIARHLAADAEFRARFQREAEAAERANHPHILPVWAHGAAGTYLYLATPLCDADLAALVEERGRMDAEEALRLLGQIAWALDWAHGRGVVHRDVKPENILLIRGRAEAHAYLGDFGMARVASAATLTQAGHPPGLSPAYAAPEQWEGGEVSPATDQYALAATLHTCLTGQPPFAGRSIADLREAHLNEPPPPVPGKPALTRALAIALAKSPEQRYGSCQELIGAARAHVDAAEPAGPTSPPTFDPRAPTDPEHPSSDRRSARTAPLGPTTPAGDTTLRPTQVEPQTDVDTTLPLPAEPQTAVAAAGETTLFEPSTSPDTTPKVPSRPGAGRGRRRGLLAAAALAVAVVAAGVAATVIGGGSSPSRPRDAAAIRVGALPVDVVAGAGSVWVADQGDNSIVRLDPDTGQRIGKPIRSVPEVAELAVGGGQLWAASPDGHFQAYSASTGRALGGPQTFDLNVDDLVLSPGYLWVADSTGRTYRLPIHGTTLGPVSKPVDTSADTRAVAFGAGLVWAVSRQTGFIHGIDPRLNSVVQGGAGPTGMDDVAVVDGQVWAANPVGHRLVRINAATGDVSNELRVPGTGSDAALAADGKQLVYLSQSDGRAVLLNATTGRLKPLPRLPGGASSVALVGGRLWVAYDSDGLVRSIPIPGAT